MHVNQGRIHHYARYGSCPGLAGVRLYRFHGVSRRRMLAYTYWLAIVCPGLILVLCSPLRWTREEVRFEPWRRPFSHRLNRPAPDEAMNLEVFSQPRHIAKRKFTTRGSHRAKPAVICRSPASLFHLRDVVTCTAHGGAAGAENPSSSGPPPPVPHSQVGV